jgi:hypothetical protein
MKELKKILLETESTLGWYKYIHILVYNNINKKLFKYTHKYKFGIIYLITPV